MIDKVKVEIINTSGNALPSYATASAAGMDVRAANVEPIVLPAHGGRALIPTGLRVSLPEGYEMQIRPRSGLALKNGITLLNSPGTIDADYRGEIGVIMVNHSDVDFTVNPGERICQMVVARYAQVTWQQVDELNETERGEGGFGHTGTR